MRTNIRINSVIGIYLACLFVCFLPGCNDFLEENPKNFLNPETFYQTQADAEGGLTGVYAILRAPGLFAGNSNGIIFLNHKNSEYTWPWSMTAADVGFVNYTPSYKSSVEIWRDTYDGIKRANSFIENMQDRQIDFPEELRRRFIAEAKFIRSLMYYYLTQCFGDVPLVERSFRGGDDFLVPRNPVEDIYDFMKSDLGYAIEHLPEKSGYSGADLARASRGAARTLKAKVHMILQEWTEAKQLLEDIIDSGQYALESDVVNNWRTANEHGVESIFEIQFASGFTPPMGNSLFQLAGPANLRHPDTGNIVGGLWTGVAYTPAFFNSFNDSDLRKQRLFFDPDTHAGPVGRYFNNKYFDPSVMFQGLWLNGPVNVKVFRYADVLLMLAEVENEINNGPTVLAYEAIDQVTDRAEAKRKERNLDKDAFVLAVFEERAKELFYEGHRFFDLKRRGFQFVKDLVEPARRELFGYINFTGDFTIHEYMMVIPVPVNEMDANPKLVQNPGY